MNKEKEGQGMRREGLNNMHGGAGIELRRAEKSWRGAEKKAD
jgi:hypothetical protein